jgi:glycosyltransferase involved in cell wall biosynthesis
MKDEPLVSVIVPAFNAGHCLAESLRSVQAQTYGRLEVLVVDAGSADDTYEVAQDFAAKDARFLALHHDTDPGLPASRNTALSRARGELIAFLDADDIWFPQKTAAQVELLRQDPRANLLFTNYWVWDGVQDLFRRYEDRAKFPEHDVSRRLCYFNLFATSSVLVKRDTLDRVGFFDPEIRAAEDWDLWLRIAETGLWARGLWEPQLRYRLWAGNASKNTVKTTSYVVRLLEKALTRPQPTARWRHYRRSLQIARGNLEFAQARARLATDPGVLTGAAWRAWRRCPWRLKWLLWYAGLIWPSSLGGAVFARQVRQKVCSKW